MHIIFQCPVCQNRTICEPDSTTGAVSCTSCDWNRPRSETDVEGDYCRCCRVCGCEDLWRQKDFPPALGLAFVSVGGLLSVIAWAQYEPVWALGILMGFALIDLVLYALMSDMLVCYRCRARHRRTPLDDEHAAFNLEVSERYVQMKKRQDEATTHGPDSSGS